MLEKLVPATDGSGFIDPDGMFWDTRSDYIMTGVLPSCGCGNPASIGMYVKDMLLKHVKRSDSSEDTCWCNNSYEDLPTMFFLSWADHEGYTEHGTTIRCSWLTPKGEDLLKDLIILEKEAEEESTINNDME